MTEYPEHEKLKAVESSRFEINQFLEWFDEWRSHDSEWYATEMLTWDEDGRTMRPKHISEMTDNQRAHLLAAYFDIDEKKLEAEKQAMLELLRGDP